ncbi:YggS family pyridoxal phosphate-dependent enzyme [Corynebacterium epidermidicanis]|uniref:Pyridoxal phosphate homeostasis protein n=1 Tax=Corynebacterium epidermidicanis TaxID=1050174 RepID=A0A0G3GSG3_9CORY|nr:YggS family pyridoxal phosphate-dependent enzyme [Corynebacterium epidermidicanis]AKK03515.1 pyridoxal phosphate enzyme, YggS family [Corynebacterium epidermidicanis]
MAAETLARKQELAENVRAVRNRIAAATAAAHRPADSVQLLPVTKFHPASDIALLAELGIRDVAENREQEARAKAEQLPQVRFHMIGQVQTKKANSVARWAHSVHSVDSIKLVDALSRGMELALERGDREDPSLECFVQLSLDGDTSRGGCTSHDADAVIYAIEQAPHLAFAGVMCVPPLASDPDLAFAAAADYVRRWQNQLGRRLNFSAGMSGDMDQAIANGSTLVRVGTAIMGPRPVG